MFPLVMTLPVDVGSRPAEVAAVAAMMLGVGYTIGAIAPLAARRRAGPDGHVRDHAVADRRRRRGAGRFVREDVRRAARPRGDSAVSSRYAEGARALAPIGIAAFGFSLSFGVLARAAGMGWAAPLVMSATTFAGSAQFAVASILKDGGAVAAAITAAVMLNARYAPMGIAVASSFEGRG